MKQYRQSSGVKISGTSPHRVAGKYGLRGNGMFFETRDPVRMPLKTSVLIAEGSSSQGKDQMSRGWVKEGIGRVFIRIALHPGKGS